MTFKHLSSAKLCQILCIPIARRDLYFFVRTWKNPQPPQPNKKSWKSKIDEWVDKASNYWEKLSKQPESSIKGRIYSWGNHIMDRIDADEWFLKEISSESKCAMVVYPTELNRNEVEERLTGLIKHRVAFHARYRYLSIVCIPFSTAAGILPGPNVFLAYNLFRLYCHDKALDGAKRLDLLLKDNQLEYVADETLNEVLRDRKDPLQNEVVEKINSVYSMPEYFVHDIKRTRKQWKHKNTQVK